MSEEPVVRTTLRQLLGRKVHDPDGAPVGRIEEVCAEERDGVLEITDFTLGAYGALTRITAGPVARLFLHLAGVSPDHHRSIPWDWLDLSDPARPTLLWPKSELPSPGEPPAK